MIIEFYVKYDLNYNNTCILDEEENTILLSGFERAYYYDTDKKVIYNGPIRAPYLSNMSIIKEGKQASISMQEQNIKTIIIREKINKINKSLTKKDYLSEDIGDYKPYYRCHSYVSSNSFPVKEHIKIDLKTGEILNEILDTEKSARQNLKCLFINSASDFEHIWYALKSDQITRLKVLKNGTLEIDEKNPIDIKYNKIKTDLKEDGLGIEIYDADDGLLKFNRTNLWKIFDGCAIEADDIRNNVGSSSEKTFFEEVIWDNSRRQIKTKLWELSKSYRCNKVLSEEIMGKSKYKELYKKLKRHSEFKPNYSGTNPQTITGFNKATLNFLNENIDSLSSHNHSSNFSNFGISKINRLLNKYGPNFTYLFKLQKELVNKVEEIKLEPYIRNSCIFNSIDDMEMLYDNNYTKNIDKLVEYLYEILPKRQGIIEINTGHNLLIDYINLVKTLKIKDFVKYPDSLKKEIDLLILRKKITEEKEYFERLKKVQDIKIKLLKKTYDDFYVEPLISQSLLSSESDRMNNCVRSYGYTLDTFASACVSIRNNNGESICTMSLHAKHENTNKHAEDSIDYVEKYELSSLKAKSNYEPTSTQRKMAQQYIDDINNALNELKKENYKQQEQVEAVM